MSGSHDQSVRVWALSGEVLAELYGHSALVYSVAATKDGLIASGARRRGVGVDSGLGCGLGGFWMMGGGGGAGCWGRGAPRYALHGAAAVRPAPPTCCPLVAHSGRRASVMPAPPAGSEDNTARVWRATGEALQSIEHPGCVWAVELLKNGDLATGCADAVARVFTSEPTRQVRRRRFRAAGRLRARRASARESARAPAFARSRCASKAMLPALLRDLF